MWKRGIAMSLALSRKILGAYRARSSAACERLRHGTWEDPKPRGTGGGIFQAGMVDCFGLTDIGKVREHNEDQFAIADLNMPGVVLDSRSVCEDEVDAPGLVNANLLLVADGVGGNGGGQRASQLAMEGVLGYLRWLHQNRHCLPFPGAIRGHEMCEDLKATLAWAQQRLQDEAEASVELARMGTTLTLAYLEWPAVYFAHVGDSRAYLYRRHELIQITNDQTIAQMLADAGVIEEERVERHALRNVLGSLLCRDAKQLLPCVYKRHLAPGDQLLLCTDGLTRHVSCSEIAEILDGTYSAAGACRELIVAANAAGGTDNTTVIVARFGPRRTDVNEDKATGREGAMDFEAGRRMACCA
jgi:protein phosphatase